MWRGVQARAMSCVPFFVCVHGCSMVGSNFAGRFGSGRVRATRPNPRKCENLLTRPDPTRPVRIRKVPDPTREWESRPVKSPVFFPLIVPCTGFPRENACLFIWGVIWYIIRENYVFFVFFLSGQVAWCPSRNDVVATVHSNDRRKVCLWDLQGGSNMRKVIICCFCCCCCCCCFCWWW